MIKRLPTSYEIQEDRRRQRRRDAMYIIGCCTGLIAVSAVLIWVG